MSAQTCNEFRREYEKEFNAVMTSASKDGVTFRGDPFPPIPQQEHDYLASLSPFYRRVYNLD